MKTVDICTDFIKLDAFLKYAGVCSTGGHAKVYVLEGRVCVNGSACFERGKKLRDGDIVKCGKDEYLVKQSL